MSNTEKQLLIMNIGRLTARIDSYRRISSEKKKIAFDNAECGYRESAQFDKGQAFVLEYVVDDLQIILDSLKDIVRMEVSNNG